MNNDKMISLVSGWHIIPFNFDDYDQIYELMNRSKGFNKMTNAFSKTVFENIRDSFLDECDYPAGRKKFKHHRQFHDNLGCYFLKQLSGDLELRIDASFYTAVGENKNYRINIDEVGVFIFHTGVGFFIYHYSYQQVLSEEMIIIQRYLKLYNLFNDPTGFRLNYISGFLPELSMPAADSVPVTDSMELSTPSKFTLKVIDHNSELSGKKVDVNASPVTFSLGLWLTGCFRNILPYVRYQMTNEISSPVCANPTKNKLNSRRSGKANSCGTTECLPAIIMNFVYCCYRGGENIDRRKLCTTAYYIANGFNSSFRLSRSIEEHMTSMYENMVYSCSQNGCSICVSYDDSNDKFFLKGFSRNLHNSYFLFYILINYQKFTLIKFSNELYQDFSDSYEIESLSLDKLVKHSGRINMFMMNSINSSVSYNDHHNKFYEYLFKRLQIKKDIEFLSMGVESLHQHLRNIKDDEDKRTSNKVSKSLAVLSLLVVFSALIDSFDFIDSAAEYFGPFSLETVRIIHIGVIVLIVVMGLCPLVLFMKLKVSSFLRKFRS